MKQRFDLAMNSVGRAKSFLWHFILAVSATNHGVSYRCVGRFDEPD
jgi:hypothetical protein